MFKAFLKSFVENIFLYGLMLTVFPVWVILLWIDNLWITLFSIFIFLFWMAFLASKNLYSELEEASNKKISDLEKDVAFKQEVINIAKEETLLWKKTLKERSSGFPTLLTLIDRYEEVKDMSLVEWLATKKHPATKAADVVKSEAQQRRNAEKECRNTKALIEYYENIAPFLLEFKDELIGEGGEAELESGYSEKEAQDPATNYLTIKEYKKLPSVEKNQLALDRYWNRPKSKAHIGRMYERYVGYLWEVDGYDVDYVGIFKGYEDLGRDLVCRKKDEIVIIQCKYWSQFKTIYEKHIFQFFGTVFQYKDENPDKRVKGIFYTSTKLSDLARRFAKELGIELREEFPMNKSYCCIKCNINISEGTKIYHLPFDQQYDNTKIEKKKGEFYCETVKEAEDKGFRRAFRWKDNTQK